MLIKGAFYCFSSKVIAYQIVCLSFKSKNIKKSPPLNKKRAEVQDPDSSLMKNYNPPILILPE